MQEFIQSLTKKQKDENFRHLITHRQPFPEKTKFLLKCNAQGTNLMQYDYFNSHRKSELVNPLHDIRLWQTHCWGSIQANKVSRSVDRRRKRYERQL
jgi:hypothetical protein